MHYVFLAAHAEVAADSAGSGVAAVCGAYHAAHYRDYVFAFKDHYNHRGGHHALHESGEERTVDKVSVVLAENSFVELHHFDACDDKAFALEAGDDVADEGALNG